MLPLPIPLLLLGAQETPLVPPSRALLEELCAEPRLAGTSGGYRGAVWVADRLREAGLEVELDEREVLLSHPRRFEVVGRRGETELFRREASFDPRAEDPGDVPGFHAWAKSGAVEAPVVDVGRGLRADYERLARAGVSVEGCIALARYGGAYRGVKIRMAEEHGCVGCLLFNDPGSDGADRGETWPDGPWKPDWAMQRGAVSRLEVAPGDPTTPGWPSPPPGEDARRLEGEALEERLPGIPSLPLGARDAVALLKAGADARVSMTIDVPRELFRIVNVLGRIEGEGDGLVIAGNHRDAWVRGAHDAGSGTVALLRAAQILAERARDGWKPPAEILFAFWDAEEYGLIGSTEWGEAHADELRRRTVAYVNMDAAVSGLELRASGTPGLSSVLTQALDRVTLDNGTTLGDPWRDGGSPPKLGLPGSGSDYTVFLHHLGIPVLDLSFGGNSGGQYHTSFDDFEFMERHLDPEWRGHELAGRTLAELLTVLAELGPGGFDSLEAARAMRQVIEDAAAEGDWLELEARERLFGAFDRLVDTIERGPSAGDVRFYQLLERQDGLPDRPWYRNQLWAPGVETGYAAETLPALRLAAKAGPEELAREVEVLIDAIRRLMAAWSGPAPLRAGPR